MTMQAHDNASMASVHACIWTLQMLLSTFASMHPCHQPAMVPLLARPIQLWCLHVALMAPVHLVRLAGHKDARAAAHAQYTDLQERIGKAKWKIFQIIG